MANSRISLQLGVLNPAEWSDITEDSPLPLQQHPCYGLALKAFGASPLQVNIHENNTLIGKGLLIHRKFFGLINFTHIFRGPAWCVPNISHDTKTAVFQELKKTFNPWRWNFLATLPEEPAGDDSTKMMETAGLRRVMTGFSTVWLDIRPEAEILRQSLKGKWRNQLVQAEKNKLEISVGGKKPHQYSWLLEREAEQRSNRKYQATPLGLVPNYVAACTKKNQGSVLSITAIAKKEKIAGALFLLHGNSATYHIGWNGEKGRDMNAQNCVLWEGICALKKAGIHFLDLGGLNTADLAGIARFKLGMGADPITLAGTYI